MPWRLELGCPQCGGGLSLNEDDRVITCDYCRVRLYIHTRGAPRFYIPPRVPPSDRLLYAPYHRFKGMSLFTRRGGVHSKVVDSTALGVRLPLLAASLGLRAQTQPLSFVAPDTLGRFISPHLDANQAMRALEERSQRLGLAASPGEDPRAPVFVGEAFSVIYTPFYVRGGQLHDALTREPLGRVSELENAEPLRFPRAPDWRPRFLPLICPNCSWDLRASRTSTILLCPHCERAWTPESGQYQPVDYEIAPSAGETEVYLPFWRLRALASPLQLVSYGDLIRYANLIKAPRPEYESQPFHFFVPAFKVRPQLFMRLARQASVLQPDSNGDTRVGRSFNPHPADLPASEALDALPPLLFELAAAKNKAFEALAELKLDVIETRLVYLPFTDQGAEVVLEGSSVSLNKKALGFGKYI